MNSLNSSLIRFIHRFNHQHHNQHLNQRRTRSSYNTEDYIPRESDPPRGAVGETRRGASSRSEQGTARDESHYRLFHQRMRRYGVGSVTETNERNSSPAEPDSSTSRAQRSPISII